MIWLYSSSPGFFVLSHSGGEWSTQFGVLVTGITGLTFISYIMNRFDAKLGGWAKLFSFKGNQMVKMYSKLTMW